VVVDVQLSPIVQAAFAGGAIQVVLDATVTDPDGTALSQASVRLEGLQGDALAFGGSLAGTGVSLVTSTATSLVFEGAASIADYVQILESVVLEPAPMAGLRQIELSVVDARGAASNTFVVNANLSATGAEVGTPGDDVLRGQPVVDDAISGFDGNDILFGDSGDDLLDGGTGNDLMDGGPGNDQLIGGPGADRLSGGPGADSQIYFSLADRGDSIFGFDAGAGDTLDFSELFDGAADPNDIDPFVRFDAAGNDVQVNVDQDGPGAASAFISVATLVDPIGVTNAQDAIDNGALVV
jgi:Ca2+-binding RTX toxin-like protein